MVNSKICYYHDDGDGRTAAAVVLSKFPECEVIPVNYNRGTWKPEDVADADIFVVDFTFEDMDKLFETAGSLTWIDHHKSAMEKFSELWNSNDIKGIRDISKSGGRLTFEYFYPDEPLPLFIRYGNDLDLWKFETPGTKAFAEYASIMLKTPKDILETGILHDDDLAREWTAIGESLLSARMHRVEIAYDKGWEITFEGYRCRVVNSNMDISEIGRYCYEDMGYPIALIWQVIGRNIICSMRSNTVNVRLIAEKYGGGGHDAAAGFRIGVEHIGMLFKQ